MRPSAMISVLMSTEYCGLSGACCKAVHAIICSSVQVHILPDWR